jgi:hypothetical protein
MDAVISKHVMPGTTLLTDEWAATKRIRFRLQPLGLKHFIIRYKKETGGGFARWAKIEPKRDPSHPGRTIDELPQPDRAYYERLGCVGPYFDGTGRYDNRGIVLDFR